MDFSKSTKLECQSIRHSITSSTRYYIPYSEHFFKKISYWLPLRVGQNVDFGLRTKDLHLGFGVTLFSSVTANQLLAFILEHSCARGDDEKWTT